MGKYNETLVDNATGIVDLYIAVNTESDMLLSIMMLAVTALVIFIASKQVYDTKTSMLASSFVATIIGVFFFAAGFITLTMLMFPIVALMFSVIALVFAGG